MILRQAITNAASELAANPHLSELAHRDAELLLLHTLQISRVTLIAHPDRDLSPEQDTLYQIAIKRRLQLEPIQYITGEQEFYGLRLHVNPAVLIPRPETEHLVEAVLKLIPANQPVKLVDIGTGSGAIAIALAVHLPLAEIIAVDLSLDALAIAERNAHDHNVADRIQFLTSDLLAAVKSHGATFDAIVSNPPYIPESDRLTLHPQVREHEPAAALFAGETGLDLYRRLIPEALSALKPTGLLALEIGHGQQQPLTHLLAGWNDLTFLNDLQQIPRVALARKPNTSDLTDKNPNQ
ncbi:peptide chain release factor N(5)-glutamine methyltransferase [Tunturiibacter empetritectus]|uniref:Release factor glutamine methyltransferase n=1 Tax=Tunturiibacter lichenicola TaxID=2051959 RepID=A0A852VJN6_9BACT|nr:peptide chain release factor N(5)-glutamine methyltransferase [Edaphobacter lichenicola]NYF91957.1 release factor glutamine methyltransferase [Edaphobacter lichenicola]